MSINVQPIMPLSDRFSLDGNARLHSVTSVSWILNALLFWLRQC
ncbi:unnamed protein product [Ixodes pacificus]